MNRVADKLREKIAEDLLAASPSPTPMSDEAVRVLSETGTIAERELALSLQRLRAICRLLDGDGVHGRVAEAVTLVRLHAELPEYID